MDGAFLKALIFFTISGITDALDGALARILNQQTLIGSYLDPIADKALLLSCFLSLAIMDVIPGWLTVIVVSRDFIILVGVSILSMIGVPFEIHPALVSKITTVLQLLTVFFVLLFQCIPENLNYTWVMILYWFTAFFTIVSGLNYMMRGIKFINHHV